VVQPDDAFAGTHDCIAFVTLELHLKKVTRRR
jgi:hypothetical protein